MSSVPDSRETDWIQTVSGRRVNPFELWPEDVDIDDIAHALANLCRFCGHTKFFYSVAEHSIHVARVAATRGYPLEMQLQALLHDSAEAYLGDVSRPIKYRDCMADYRAAEEWALVIILEKYGCHPRLDPEIKRIDNALLAHEGRVLLGSTKDWHLTEPPVEGIILKGYHPDDAKAMFLQFFRALGGERAGTNASKGLILRP